MDSKQLEFWQESYAGKRKGLRPCCSQWESLSKISYSSAYGDEQGCNRPGLLTYANLMPKKKITLKKIPERHVSPPPLKI